MRIVHGLRFDNIRGDIYGGLTAAVVALPLALAFGVASGAGALPGVQKRARLCAAPPC